MVSLNMPTSSDRRYDAFISYSHAADMPVARAVERGLQQLAKPWYQRRALRIFRDESQLTATPGLWTTIADAIAGSGAFVLIASPEAAQSTWVAREIEQWRAKGSMQRFFIAVSAGSVRWDAAAGDFDWSATDCLPRLLSGAFTEEPLYVDLRFVREERISDTGNPRLRTAVARLAAPVRGIAFDELIADDLRLHRRALNLARAAVAVLIALSAAAVTGAVLALRAREAADEARRAAVQAQREAEQQALSANAKRLAMQGMMAEQIEERPDLGLLLILQSLKLEPSASAYRALSTALSALNTLEVYLHAPEAELGSVAFSSDGKRVSALTQFDETLTWNLEAPQRAPEHAHFHRAEGLTLSDAGSEVLVTSEGVTIAVDRASRTVARPGDEGVEVVRPGMAKTATIPVPVDDVSSLALSPGGDVLAVGSRTGEVTLWDARTARRLGALLRGHLDAMEVDERAVGAVAIGPGTQVAVGYDDGWLVLWRGARWSALHAEPLEQVYSAINRVVFDVQGGRMLVAYGRSAAVWDLQSRTSEPLLGAESIVHDLTFSPDGRRIAAVTSRAVLVFSYGDRDMFVRALPSPHAVSVVATVVHPDARAAWSLDYNGRLARWDLVEPAIVRTSELSSNAGSHAVFSQDGRWLCTLEDEGQRLARWDLALDPPSIASRVELSHPASVMALSRDGSVAAIGAGSRLAIVRFEHARAEARWLDDAREPIFALALSEDARWLAASHEEKGFFVQDLQTGQRREAGAGHTDTVSGLAFNRDTSWLATGGMDQRVGRWRTADLTKPVSLRRGHNGQAHTVVAFNPATDQLVSSGSDALVLLWPASDAEEPLPLIGHVRPTYAFAFAPNGETLLAGDGDSQVLLWEIAPERWRQRGCKLVNRELTDDEWKVYVGTGAAEPTCAQRR